MENQNDALERVVKFRKALKEIFKGPNGDAVIEFLEEAYVDTPAVDSTSELTYYKLGQKEFVQGLLRDIKCDIPEYKTQTGE